MAKDSLGREIAANTPAAAYRNMAETAAVTQLARKRMTNPMQTLGQDVRAGADGVGRGMQAFGAAMNQAPKVVGAPAAGVANAIAKGVANFQTGLTGEQHKPQSFEALTLGQMWDRTMKPGAPAAAAPLAVPATAPTVRRPETTYTPGAGLPSAAQVASDKARASTAQAASDMRLSAQPGVSGQPTNIGVRRQANGVLEFSGQGGGDGTGAVTYSGLPNWKSAQGGAGQGSADFGGQAFKPAQAAVAAANSPMTAYSETADAIGRGEGGAVGVAQNKAKLAALAPLLERQMANENSTGVAKIGAETTRRGQDLGLKGEMARVDASIYGTDVGAQTAREAQDIERERVAVAQSAAKAKASGDPLKVRQAQLLELEYAAKTGMDANTGKQLSEAQRTQLYKRVLELKTPQTVVPYGGFGMVGEE